MNQTTNGIATAAVLSPLWMKSLEELSAIASMVLPILGALWLAIQILGYLWKVYNRKDDE